MNTLYITVKDFSNVAENDTLDLGLPADGFAIVNIGIDEYITDSPPYTGIVNFSKTPNSYSLVIPTSSILFLTVLYKEKHDRS